MPTSKSGWFLPCRGCLASTLLSPLLWLCRLLPSVDLESTNDSDQLNRKAPSLEGAFCCAFRIELQSTINREEPSVRQVVMARQGHPRAFSDDLRRHLSGHHCPVHSPSGRLHSGGIDAALLDQPGDLSLCRWWPWVPSVVWHVASRCDSRPVCHPDPQINRVLAI